MNGKFQFQKKHNHKKVICLKLPNLAFQCHQCLVLGQRGLWWLRAVGSVRAMVAVKGVSSARAIGSLRTIGSVRGSEGYGVFECCEGCEVYEDSGGFEYC